MAIIKENNELNPNEETVLILNGQLENAQMRLKKLENSNELRIGLKIAAFFKRFFH